MSAPINGMFTFRRDVQQQNGLTGTAAWTFVNISQYILGVYPTHNGLSVDPCIPTGFGDFTLTRRYRDAMYNIKVTNASNVQKGVKKLVDMTCTGFAEETASESPAPGGGSISAYMGERATAELGLLG